MSDAPYLNRGSYRWVPDDYASTSGDNFGVTQAYASAVVDYGRPQNLLPPIPGQPRQADTIVLGRNLIDVATGAPLDGGLIEPTSIDSPLVSPFLRLLMRGSSRDLNSLPDPPVRSGVGFSSENHAGDSFYFFSTTGLSSGRLASVVLEYLLLADSGTTSDRPPVDIYVVYEPGGVGSWLNMSGPLGGGRTWGPPSQQVVDDPIIDGYLAQIAGRLGSGELQAAPLRPLIRTGTTIDDTSRELSFVTSGLAGTAAAWAETDRLPRDPIKASGDYWTINEYHPRAKGILICPSPGRDLQRKWTMILSGVRVYDAMMCNAVPAHTLDDEEVGGQFPCKIFGYAWRTAHEVPVVNGGMQGIQPTPYGRSRTFRFRLYHPDRPTLGVAHGVRFYYFLVAVEDPWSAAVQGGFTLVGTLSSLASGTAWMRVRYAGIWPGIATLNFFPTTQQRSVQGRVVNGGQFAHSRGTVALRCFRYSSGTPSTSPAPGSGWVDIGQSDLPATTTNGVCPLWYDDEGSASDWYAFLALQSLTVQTYNPEVPSSFSGGTTPPVRGNPRTDLPGAGAFMMPKTLSDGFETPDKVTVHAKAATASPATLRGSVAAFCSANPKSHLATFVSDTFNLDGGRLQMYAGTWSMRFAASVDADAAMSTQLFYRVAIVPGDVDLDSVNGAGLWSVPGVAELKFPPSGAESTIGVGTPSFAEVLASIPLTKTEGQTIDYSWLIKGATGQATPGYEDRILVDIPGSPASGRLVLQVWAIATPRAGGLSDPAINPSHPVTSLSWGGDVNSMFRTTVIEVKSDAIYAQQDTTITDYIERDYDYILMDGSGNAPIKPGVRPERDYPLYANRADAGEQVPEAIGSHGVLSDTEDLDDSTLSVGGLVVSPRRDSYHDQAQILDFDIGSAGNEITYIGASTVAKQTIAVSFDWVKSRPQFDVDVMLGLYALASDGFSMFEICRSNGTTLSGESGATNISMNIAQGFRVPDPNSRLVMRMKMWSYANGVAEDPVPGDVAPDWDAGYRGLDLSKFKLEFGSSLSIIVGQQQIGNKDWYLGLPTCSARTFGSSDYQFVLDASRDREFYLPPTTIMEGSSWVLEGWMFSPFWFVDMPEGSVFEFQDHRALSGTMNTAQQHQGLRVRTAVDILPSMSLSSDRDAGYIQGQANIVVSDMAAGGGSTSSGNRIRVIEYPDSTADRSVERIVRVGDEYIFGNNPLVISLSKDDPSLYGRSQEVHRPVRHLIYEVDEFDEDADRANVVVLCDYGGATWRNPTGGGDTGPARVTLTRSMKMLHGAVDPVSNGLYVVGFRATDRTSPTAGGMVAMRDTIPTSINGTTSAHAGPLRFIDGTPETTISSSQPLVYPCDPNTLGDGGTPLPAAESFPAVMVGDGRILVLYTLLTRTETEATRALGKVFCRISYNGGASFGAPFPVADLGYNTARAISGVSANDESFQIRHVSVCHDRHGGRTVLFFWADGKIFMKVLDSIIDHSAALVRPRYSEETTPDPCSMQMNTHLVAGNVDFLSATGASDASSGSGLQRWLSHNWNPRFVMRQGERYTNYMYDSGVPAVGDDYPSIFITKWPDEPDVAGQRVAAYVSSSGQSVHLFLLDGISQVQHREIGLSADTLVYTAGDGQQFGGHVVGPLLAINPTVI